MRNEAHVITVFYYTAQALCLTYIVWLIGGLLMSRWKKFRPKLRMWWLNLYLPPGYYALQYPDGDYAIESNCQGWLSTTVKPKLGDKWCFSRRQALWLLEYDLRTCKPVQIE